MRRVVLALLLTTAGIAPAGAQSLFSGGIADGTFYAGVIGGFTSGNVAGHYEGTMGPPPPPAVVYDFTLQPHGLSFGILLGYEIPWDRFVLRIEGDASFVAGASQTHIYPLDTTRQDTVSIGSTAHLRGIIGMPMGTFTPFIAAGVGIAGITASHQGPLGGGGTQTWTQSALLAGPSIGVGTDIALGDGMTGRIEVLGDFFGSRHFDWTGDNTRYSDITLGVFTARAGITIPIF